MDRYEADWRIVERGWKVHVHGEARQFGSARQAIETCGIAEQMLSDEILLRTTGDPFWADHCEEVAFNTGSLEKHLPKLRHLL